MAQQVVYRFYGNVQGVGFRWTTWNLAKNHDVTGYVRNMPDGSVECLVEGQNDKIVIFIEELTQRMGSFIRKTTCQAAPASGGYVDFSIAF